MPPNGNGRSLGGRIQIETPSNTDTTRATLQRRVEQLRAQIRAKRLLQRPFDFVFFWLEQSIARSDNEIERLKS